MSIRKNRSAGAIVCYDSSMEKRESIAACPDEYLTAFGLDADRVIYFDIETTGFRPSTSSLYMIGWAVREKASRWTVTQVLAQSRPDEPLLLQQFRDVLDGYDTIIAFNGDRFDLPYLKEKFTAHGMEDPFQRFFTVDLYRQIRPYKHAFGTGRLNQKSVEEFLGIRREDPYNGGELIDVYRSVRDHRCQDNAAKEAAMDALFLHNREDVLGMLSMTALLAYPLAADSTSPVQRMDSPGLGFCFPLPVPVPEPLRLSLDPQGGIGEVILSGKEAAVILRPCSGTLFHFFPDYQNYYYLPAEDMAIHKSVASFVSPAHREKAKAGNCYVRKSGLFLPQPGEIIRPVFHRTFKDPVSWFEYMPGMEEESALFASCIHALVRSALKSC